MNRSQPSSAASSGPGVAIETKTAFDSILVSSREHLSRFEEVVKNATFLEKCLSSFGLPEEFPNVRVSPLLPMRMPLVFFSTGSLTLHHDRLVFAAHPLKLPIPVPLPKFLKPRTEHVDETLQFEVKKNELQRLDLLSPSSQGYQFEFVKLSWVSITTSLSGRASSLLLSQQAPGPTSKRANAGTEVLEASLRCWLAGEP